MSCISICCSKGVFYDGRCRCDLGYYGETCQSNIIDNFESEYFTFVGIFSLLFFILFCISLSLLIRSINSYDSFTYSKYLFNHKSFCQRCFSVITAPKNLIFVLSILLCIFRLLYIITYPFQLYQEGSRVIERLITDFPFTILFYVYGILLIVWYTIYDEISFNIATLEQKNDRDWIFRHYKVIMKIRLFLVLLLQIVISTINGLRLNTEFKTLLYVLYALLIMNFISFILEFYLYGTNLYKCIQGQLQQQEQWFLEHREKEKALETQFDKSIIRREITSKSPNQLARTLNGRSPIQQQTILSQYSQKPIEQVKQADVKPKLNQIKRKQSFGVTFVNRAPSMSSNFRQESFGEIGKQKTITEADIECSIIDASDNYNTPQEFHDSPFNKKRSKSFVLDENDQLTIWDCQEQKDIVSQIQNNQIEVIKQTKQLLINETSLRKSQSPINQSAQYDDGKNQYCYQFDLSFQNQLQEYFKLQKKQTLQTDMTVLKNIQLLVQCGILFEILFLILAIIVIATNLLQNPEGALVYLYVTNTLQFLSLVVVLKLFRDVQSKQIMNLIWIQKVGSKRNKINEKFSFMLPQEIKDTDKTMVKFEERINTQQFY